VNPENRERRPAQNLIVSKETRSSLETRGSDRRDPLKPPENRRGLTCYIREDGSRVCYDPSSAPQRREMTQGGRNGANEQVGRDEIHTHGDEDAGKEGFLQCGASANRAHLDCRLPAQAEWPGEEEGVLRVADFYALLDHWYWGGVCSFGRTLEEIEEFGFREYAIDS